MRDLAKSHSYLPKKSFARARILRISVIVFIIVVAVYFVGTLIGGGSIGGAGGEGVHDAPAGLTPVQVSGAPISVAGGVNLSSDTATLKNVAGVGGSATATRVYGNGGYSLNVSATLPNPHAHSYAVFLVGSDGKLVFADFMSGSGTSWNLNFNDTDKYSKLSGILITEKITKESKEPETRIMQGSF